MYTGLKPATSPSQERIGHQGTQLEPTTRLGPVAVEPHQRGAPAGRPTQRARLVVCALPGANVHWGTLCNGSHVRRPRFPAVIEKFWALRNYLLLHKEL
jgi:hypothetical protein